MKKYGLIGKKLSHSFSKKYFSEKFEKERITGVQYELYELKSIRELPNLISKENLDGLNVTIPYKQEVISFLDELDESALKVNAVNVIKRSGDKFIGYNSDYFGFLTSLKNWYQGPKHALILGTGGSSQAVAAALDTLGFEYLKVSRTHGNLTYKDLQMKKYLLIDHPLIINTTPLGMSPAIDTLPDLDYSCIGSNHYFYDLVYNPKITAFMKKGEDRGAKTKNGLEMLILQAEKSWGIWQSED